MASSTSLGGSHHQVGQLVDDNDNLGHGGQCFMAAGHLIVAFQIPDIVFRKGLVPAEHLTHCPVEGAGCLLRIGDHRHQQMGNTVVNTQFHHLGVDHQQLDLLIGGLIENAHDDRVDAHRLTRTGGTGNEHMGHLCQIRQHDVAGNIPSQRHRELALGAPQRRPSR